MKILYVLPLLFLVGCSKCPSFKVGDLVKHSFSESQLFTIIETPLTKQILNSALGNRCLVRIQTLDGKITIQTSTDKLTRIMWSIEWR